MPAGTAPSCSTASRGSEPGIVPAPWLAITPTIVGPTCGRPSAASSGRATACTGVRCPHPKDSRSPLPENRRPSVAGIGSLSDSDRISSSADPSAPAAITTTSARTSKASARSWPGPSVAMRSKRTTQRAGAPLPGTRAPGGARDTCTAYAPVQKRAPRSAASGMALASSVFFEPWLQPVTQLPQPMHARRLTPTALVPSCPATAIGAAVTRASGIARASRSRARYLGKRSGASNGATPITVRAQS